MFLKKRTNGFTESCLEKIARLKQEIDRADTIVIGAGSGLSASAGLTYSGKRFADLFGDFIEKYGYRDMYSAGFHPYETPEEYWAYWSRHIFWNRYAQPAGQPYLDLLALVQEKDFFAVTTNVDHCFQKAGFDKRRLFYTQGDYGLWQCAKPCRQKTYDNEAAVRRMASCQKGMRVPPELVPRCPACGGPVAMNLRCDNRFVEDAGWHEARGRYVDFLRGLERKRVLYLELGVGGNTPAIIKYPFWESVRQNGRARYACVNLGEAFAPEELAGRSICLDCDIGDALKALLRMENK